MEAQARIVIYFHKKEAGPSNRAPVSFNESPIFHRFSPRPLLPACMRTTCEPFPLFPRLTGNYVAETVRFTLSNGGRFVKGKLPYRGKDLELLRDLLPVLLK